MSKQHDFQVLECPVLTVDHLTEGVAIALMGRLPGEDFHGLPVLIGAHEALVSCGAGDMLDASAPTCLKDAVAWVRRNGFAAVKFAVSGDQIGELTVYPY